MVFLPKPYKLEAEMVELVGQKAPPHPHPSRIGFLPTNSVPDPAKAEAGQA